MLFALVSQRDWQYAIIQTEQKERNDSICTQLEVFLQELEELILG